MSAAAAAWLRKQARYIAGAVADKRIGFFSQGGKNQLAFGSLRQNFAGLGIDCFNKKMIFKNMHSIAAFEAFHRDARADNFRKAEEIQCRYIESLFNFVAHRLVPGFSSENTHTQF